MSAQRIKQVIDRHLNSQIQGRYKYQCGLNNNRNIPYVSESRVAILTLISSLGSVPATVPWIQLGANLRVH